jgi:hypothetical protein
MHLSLKTIIFLGFVVIFGTLSGKFTSDIPWVQTHFVSRASAEDDDDEFEVEDEDDDRKTSVQTAPSSTSTDKQTKKTSTKTIQVIQNVVEYTTVTKTIDVTEEQYKKDSDGDLLVDAIDPSPLVKQSEYFTDTDNDGVPNAFDRRHDEDDFAYFDDAEKDANNNGILDSYEMEKR